MTRRESNRQGGFMTTAALLLFALVAAAAGTAVALMRTDVARTLAERRDAQLRQFLFAAVVDAPAHLGGGAPANSWTMAVPDGVSVAAHASVSGKTVIVTFEARVEDRRMREDATFDTTTSPRKLTGLSLED